MKKIISLFIAVALVVCFMSFPTSVSAVETANDTSEYSEHLTGETAYDISNSNIAWVKQASGALVWVPANDARTDDEVIEQAKAVDNSLTNGASKFAVMRGVGIALTPNTKGAQATITVSETDSKLVLGIDGKYSHFVKALANVEPVVPEETVAPEEPTAPAEPVVEGEKVSIRIDAPKKMAVAFPDGTVYYGGEMKEVVVGQEYPFQMCAVNWDNGIYDGKDNGIAGTVVYRMVVVHQKEFNEIAKIAKDESDRYIVKGIDVIDVKDKKIVVNGDAKDAHLETDVNSFFMAYRFHFEGQDYDKKTGIEKVVNTPIESLSVNLPVGATITCDAYFGNEKVASDEVLIMKNSGEGIYADEYLTSVNDYTWRLNAAPAIEAVAVQEHIEYAK